MNQSRKLSRQRRKSTGHVLIVAFLVIWAMLILIPFWNALVISFMPAWEVTRHPAAMFPNGFTLENYSNIIKRGGLLEAYQTTVFITFCGTIYGMSISTAMAYAFSQRFPGKKFFFILMVFTMYFSGGVVPTFLLIRRLGLMNHVSCIILMGGVSAWNIIIMKNGFENTPQALVEAGKIDGANDLRIFFQIMLPLQAPILATFSLFTAVGYWNEWFWSSLVLSVQGTQPLMVFLRNITYTVDLEMQIVSAGTAYKENVFPLGIKMAAVFLTMLPIMCVYPFLQKYFMKGLTIGAVKM